MQTPIADPRTIAPRRLVSLLLVGVLAAGAMAATDDSSTADDMAVSSGVALATSGVNERADLVVPLPGGGAAFLASEAGEQRDLNGDGDTTDAVLHAVDSTSGETRNLGHAVAAEPGAVMAVGDRRIAFISRGALHIHDLGDGSTVVVSQGVLGGLTRLADGELVFTSLLRGGSSQQTAHLHVFDPADGSVVDTGLSGTQPRPSAGGFVVAEPVDLDGDGTVDDVRIATWDLRTGTATVTTTTSLFPPEPLAGGTRAAFIAMERDIDRNGDGDTDDALAAAIDLTTGVVTTSEAALRRDDLPGPGDDGPFTALPDGRVAFVATDSGGDEHVVFDPTTGAVLRTGLPAMPPTPDQEALPAHLVLDTTHVAFRSGGTVHVLDLADGSVADTAVPGVWAPGMVATTTDGRLAMVGGEHLHVHDPATGATTQVLAPRRADGTLGTVTAVGADVVYSNLAAGNGAVSQVVRVTSSGAVIEVDVAFGVELLGLDGRLGVTAAEAGTDRNGDGDTADHVLQVVTLAADPDVAAPAVSDVRTLPDPVEAGEPLTLLVNLRDTGGTIAGAEVAIDGVASADSALFSGPVEVTDGAFDEASEELRTHLAHSPVPGTHELCVWTWDDRGNTSADTCTRFEVLPGEGPVVTEVTATPERIQPGESIHVAATIDDTDTGGAFVAGGIVTLDGAEVAQLAPEPGGEFDLPVEYGEATIGPLEDVGAHDVCVEGVDRNGNWSTTPRCVTVEVLDEVAPIVTGAVARPTLIAPGAPLEIDVVASDVGRGGSTIVAVTATFKGEPLEATPRDGALDGPVEEFLVQVPSARTRDLDAGTHQVCLRAVDAAGNTSVALHCVAFEVERDEVVGSGRIDTFLGGGTFSMMVERPDGVGPAVGTVEYVEGPLQFAADNVRTLEVEASRSAVVSGSGRLNGQVECTFRVDVTEDDPSGAATGSFSIRLDCGPDGLLRHTAAGPLTSGSIEVRGG